MPLAQEKQEDFQNPNKIEQIGESGQAVEEELEKVTREAGEAIESNTGKEIGTVKAIPSEKPDSAKEQKDVEIETTKPLGELETELANKIYNTSLADLEKDLEYKKMLGEVSRHLMDDYNSDEGKLAGAISDTAYRVSKGDVGTYAHLLSVWEADINDRLKKTGI